MVLKHNSYFTSVFLKLKTLVLKIQKMKIAATFVDSKKQDSHDNHQLIFDICLKGCSYFFGKGGGVMKLLCVDRFWERKFLYILMQNKN